MQHEEKRNPYAYTRHTQNKLYIIYIYILGTARPTGALISSCIYIRQSSQAASRKQHFYLRGQNKKCGVGWGVSAAPDPDPDPDPGSPPHHRPTNQQ